MEEPYFPVPSPLFTDLYLGEVGPSTAPSKEPGLKEESNLGLSAGGR